MNLLKPQDKLRYKVQYNTQNVNLFHSTQGILPAANSNGLKKCLYSFIIHEGTKRDCPHGGHLDATIRDHTGLDRLFISKAFCKLCFKWMIYNIEGFLR